MKLTNEEYSFFAKHAPKDFDLSLLRAEPCPENEDELTVDREAFIVLAGKTDHSLAAPIGSTADGIKPAVNPATTAMGIVVPVLIGVLVVVVLLIGNEIFG